MDTASRHPAPPSPLLHRRQVLALLFGSGLFWPALTAQGIDLETARERGDAKLAAQEARQLPRVRLPSGVVYRDVRPGNGAAIDWRERPDVWLSWSVLRASDLYFQFGSQNRLSTDESYFRIARPAAATAAGPAVCGLVQGLVGAREHGIRRIWVPPELGYVTGKEQPQPPAGDFGAHRKLTLIQQRRLPIVFEVEVVRVRPHANNAIVPNCAEEETTSTSSSPS